MYENIKKMSKTGRINFRIRKEKKDKIIEIAGKQEMSLTEFTEFLYDREIHREFGFDIDTNI